MPPAVFPSKVDTWLACVIGVSVVVSAAVAIYLLVGFFLLGLSAERGVVLLSGTALLLLGVILPVWMMLTTRYTFDDGTLIIASGPFKWRVPLSEVRSVRPTRDLGSSPALSLDRLRIEYGTRWIMVSPRDRTGFLAALEARGVATRP
jgi:hypothetical protein